MHFVNVLKKIKVFFQDNKKNIVTFFLVMIGVYLIQSGVSEYLETGTGSESRADNVKNIHKDSSVFYLAELGINIDFQGTDYNRLSFKTRSKNYKIKDFKNKYLILNLWATWCAPCVKELPSLDNLQKSFSRKKLQVLAINVERKSSKELQLFFDKLDITNLDVYFDKTLRILTATRTSGEPHPNSLPLTLIIDRNGKELGRLRGGYKWDKEDMINYLSSIIK